MKKTDQTNIMDVAGRARSELEQAQIICVIGKDSFNTAFCFLLFFLLPATDRRFSGGPGVGKGTQCAKMAKDLGVVHLSIGEVLRSTASTNQEIDITAYMRAGKLVPKELVQAVLEAEISTNVKAGRTHILLDGFPRSTDQMEMFERGVSARSH